MAGSKGLWLDRRALLVSTPICTLPPFARSLNPINPTQHQNAYLSPNLYGKLAQLMMVFYFYPGLRSENPNHRFLGLIGLPCLEKTITTSSSTSSTSSSTTSSSTTSSSTTFLPLPPLLPLPPFSPLLSLSPFPPCCGEASDEASGGVGKARHCGGAAPRLSRCYCCSGARFSGISGPGVGGAVAFFPIGLLPLFVSSKIAGPR